MDSKKWCYDRRLQHDEVTRKIRTEHMAEQNASGFLKLDRIEAGLLCLLAMREGEKQLLTVAGWGSSSLSGSVSERSLGGSTVGADGPAAGQKLIMVTSSSVLGSVLERMVSSECCAVVKRCAGCISTTSTSSSPSGSESEKMDLRSSGSSSRSGMGLVAACLGNASLI